MRTSGDQIVDGFVINGFDYQLQCWVINGIIQRCGHPDLMKCGCYGRDHAGERIQDTRAHDGSSWAVPQ